jgi:hypothetical protein
MERKKEKMGIAEIWMRRGRKKGHKRGEKAGD